MDNLFFYISKLAWMLINPGTLLVILILATAILFKYECHKLAGRLLYSISGVLVIILLFPVGSWLLTPLENQFPTNPELPENIDGIILLGGTEDVVLSPIWNSPELGAAAERYVGFIDLAHRYPEAKLIFTGGSGSLIDQTYKGADIAKSIFSQLHFDVERIMFERDSRNTYENAILSKPLAQPAKNENWVLITTAWHMPRSIGIFCKANWPVIPYPVDHNSHKGHNFSISNNFIKHLDNLSTGIKEWVGLFAYYATGKTTSLLPKNC